MGSDRTLTAVKYPLAVHYQLSEDGEHIVPYLGVDAIFAKKKGDMAARLVGYQLTLGSGIGFDVHCNRMKTISIFRNKKEISMVTFGPGHHPVAMTK